MNSASVLAPIAAIYLALAGQAAPEILVSGEVVARTSGAPIASASVVAFPADGGDPVTGALTTSDGRFTIVGLDRGA